MQDICPLWSASHSVLIRTLIYHVVWYCTQSADVLPPSASHLKVSSNLFKHCHYWVCVSGSDLPICYLLHEGLHVNKLLLGEGKFQDVLIDGCINEEVSTDCLVKTSSIQDVAGCRTLRIDHLDHPLVVQNPA